MLKKFIFALVAISPILINSFFVNSTNFPPFAITLYILSILAFISFSYFTFFIFKRDGSKANLLNFSLFLVGIVAAIVYVFLGDNSTFFNFYGKGIQNISSVNILAFTSLLFMITLLPVLYRKVAMCLAGLALFIDAIIYLTFKFAPNFSGYVGYGSVPLVSFGNLLSLPVIYAASVLALTLILSLLDKKGIEFNSVSRSAMYPFKFVAVLLMLLFIGNTIRIVAAKFFVTGVTQAYAGDVVKAKKNIAIANDIAPFDVYYLAEIDLITADIQNLLSTTTVPQQMMQERYITLVNSQIDLAKKAIDYDESNPKNYLALGAAYERSILLTKDEGYQRALEAYEQARKLIPAKDYIDTIKARLAFSLNKDEDAFSYIDNALKSNPNSASALYTMSQYYAAKQDYKTSLEYAEKTVVASPNDVDARMQLGFIYYSVREYTAAADQFYVAYQINSNNNTALYYLVDSLISAGNTSVAKQALDELSRRFPDSTEVAALKARLN